MGFQKSFAFARIATAFSSVSSMRKRGNKFPENSPKPLQRSKICASRVQVPADCHEKLRVARAGAGVAP